MFSTATARKLGLAPGMRVYRVANAKGAFVGWLTAYDRTYARQLAERAVSRGEPRPLRVSEISSAETAGGIMRRLAYLELTPSGYAKNPRGRKRASASSSRRSSSRKRASSSRRSSSRKRASSSRRASSRSSRRRNPAGDRERLAGAVLMSGHVMALEYRHAQSRTRAAYRHDFNSGGVELWALPNGELLLRKPGTPLWDTFTVKDSE